MNNKYNVTFNCDNLEVDDSIRDLIHKYTNDLSTKMSKQLDEVLYSALTTNYMWMLTTIKNYIDRVDSPYTMTNIRVITKFESVHEVDDVVGGLIKCAKLVEECERYTDEYDKNRSLLLKEYENLSVLMKLEKL